MLKPLTSAQQAWVDALRSGEYKQTTMTLQHGDAFCCLGVACKVAEQHGVTVKYNEDDDELEGETLEHHQNVVDWLGLKTAEGSWQQTPDFHYPCPNILKTYLTSLNDDVKLTFAELADVIEWNADVLFKE